MSRKEYQVKREHIGDRHYFTGERRTVSGADAKHLLGLGVISEIEVDAKAKAEADAKAKAEADAKNKAE